MLAQQRELAASANGPRRLQPERRLRAAAAPAARSCGSGTRRPARPAKASRSRWPTVRKRAARARAAGAAASARSATSIQRSPAWRRQGGRSRRSRGTPAARQAASAWRPICAAKGWLASISRSIARARRKRARPSAPPKPPTRTSPGSARGARVRPASELIASRPPRPAQAAASAQASVVPARIRTRIMRAGRRSDRAGRRAHQPRAWPISAPSRSKIITSTAPAPSSWPSATRRARERHVVGERQADVLGPAASTRLAESASRACGDQLAGGAALGEQLGERRQVDRRSGSSAGRDGRPRAWRAWRSRRPA